VLHWPSSISRRSLATDAKVIHATLYILYGEALMKYTERRLNDFNTHG
jgi:hypothetical protein